MCERVLERIPAGSEKERNDKSLHVSKINVERDGEVSRWLVKYFRCPCGLLRFRIVQLRQSRVWFFYSFSNVAFNVNASWARAQRVCENSHAALLLSAITIVFLIRAIRSSQLIWGNIAELRCCVAEFAGCQSRELSRQDARLCRSLWRKYNKCLNTSRVYGNVRILALTYHQFCHLAFLFLRNLTSSWCIVQVFQNTLLRYLKPPLGWNRVFCFVNFSSQCFVNISCRSFSLNADSIIYKIYAIGIYSCWNQYIYITAINK